MFFFLSKFLHFLIVPLNWIIGLTAYGIFGKNAQRKRRALRTALGILVIGTNPLIGNLVAGWYEEPGKSVAELNAPYDYALILGGFSNTETEYNADRLNLGDAPNRLTQSVDLYRQGLVKKMLLSGGSGQIFGETANEALITADYLKRLGLPATDYLIDKKSRNTYENFYYSKKLLETDSTARILVLTSAFHIPRSRMIAAKAELECDFFATDFFAEQWNWAPSDTVLPDLKYLKMWQVMIKEWIGIVVYRLRGYA